MKVVSGGGVAIRVLAKTPFGTTVGATIGIAIGAVVGTILAGVVR